jgi:hypothetical protein
MDHQSGEGNRLQASLFPMSAVRGRHPDDLNEGIPDHYDGVHPSTSKHAFEWWYFDGRFSDGHTFAGTIQGKEPQIYMHINTPGGEQLDVRVSHPRSAFKGSTERCEVECAGSTVSGSYPSYDVHMSGDGVEAHLRFESLLPGWARGDGSVVIGSYGHPEVFGWCVPQPRARVTGTLTYGGVEHQVEGEGYHDHNWGDFNFTKYLSRWHWGRVTTPEMTLVFADVVTRSTCGRVHMPLLLIARGDRLAFETYEMEWHYDDFQLDASGLQAYPRTLGFTFAERDVKGRVDFVPKQVLELDDLLKDAKVPSWAEGVIGKAVAQPVYFRLDSAYEGEIDFGGEIVPVSGDTIIEYMIFTLRRGHHPYEGTFRHFLKPPKLGRLRGPS